MGKKMDGLQGYFILVVGPSSPQKNEFRALGRLPNAQNSPEPSGGWKRDKEMEDRTSPLRFCKLYKSAL